MLLMMTKSMLYVFLTWVIISNETKVKDDIKAKGNNTIEKPIKITKT